MNESFANLRKELNSLAETFQRLGARLAENARGMREELAPPDETLAPQIAEACQAFAVLRNSVVETAQSPQLPTFEEPHLNGHAASLRGLQSVIERMERKHAELMDLRQRATGLLDEVARLKYRGQGDLPELRDCQDRAQALRSRLTGVISADLLPEINAVANRETAFADLLDLIIGEALDDDRATSLSFKVEGAFGRRLVVAALRGQIGYADPRPPLDSPPVPPPPVPPPPVPPTAPVAPAPVSTEPSTEPAAETSRLDFQSPPNEAPAQPEVAVGEPAPESAAEPAGGDPIEVAPAAGAADTEALRPPVTAPIDAIPVFAPESEAVDAEATTLIEIEALDAILIEVGDEVSASGQLPESFESPESPEPPELLELTSLPESEEAQEAVSEPIPPLDTDFVPEPDEARERVNGKIRITEELTSHPFNSNTSSAREIAYSLLCADKPYPPESLSALLWQLLSESRLGLAYHLSAAMERSLPDLPNHLPARLIRSLALSRHVRFDPGEIASSLERDLSRLDEAFFEKLDANSNQEWSLAVNLLLVASVLRPALLAPSTQAENVLASVRLCKGLDAFATYCRSVFDFTVYRQPFDPRLLAPAPDPSVQQAELEDLIRQVRAWYARVSRLDLNHAAAQRLWAAWLSSHGRIGSLLQTVIQNDLRRLAAVKSEVAMLADEAAIEAAVRQASRESTGPETASQATLRWTGDYTDTTVIERIRKHTREALAFAQHWADAQQSLLRQQREEPFTRTRELSAALAELRDDAIENLESFKRGERSRFAICGAQLCLRAISELDRLLTGAEEAAPEPAVREILNADLLRIPDIPLDIRWEPDGVADQLILRGIIEVVADTRFDWQKAYEMRARREDHEATLRIIEHLSTTRNPGPRLNDLLVEREAQVQQSRQSLHAATDTVRQKIEAAVIADWLDDTQRAAFLARLDRIERRIPQSLRFFEENESLKNLNLELESHCARMRTETESRLKREIESLRQRLESLRATLKDADRQQILAALDDGDPVLAEQYLRRAAQGEELPVSDQEAVHLKAFFPGGLKTLATLSGSILAGGSLTEDVRTLLPERVLTDDLLRAVQAWDEAKQTGQPNAEGLRAILHFLGFNFHGMESYRTRAPGDLLVRMSLPNLSVRIPAPKYGADSRYQYRLVCLNDSQSAEELAALIAGTADNTPVIVFYFGSLIEEQRRKLARQCNEQRLIFLVLDDLLLLHLCKLPAPRTEAFFHCTLPFSFSNPYNPDRPAPSEMFFGREPELGKLLDPNGPCFIFGGRRIGKTSLLFEAKRRFDRLNDRGDWAQLALYLDLSAEAIGTERPLDYLWKKMSDMLIETTDVNDPSRQAIGASLLAGLVRKWLDGDESRKLIFLLDNADLFLRLDGAEGFSRCNRLKALMDEPGYRARFKAVFAGGADTLRAAGTGGFALAQHGGSLRLEALQHIRENVPAAIQLIEKVFAGIGYEFESPELIMQILSLTDYHPSLIHLYCQHLIKHLTGPHAPAFDSDACPPYLIKAAHLREAFQNPDLLKRVRASLLSTLELDRRHLVIALILASRVAGHSDDAGFDPAWIRRHALAAWPEGFSSSHSIFDIRGLLDEMVELGFLCARGGRYHLQSPQLLVRLGTRDDLELTLAASGKLIPSPVFEAAFSRTAYSSQVSRRSPLTMRQFHALRKRESGVSILFGCKALELDIADLFLSHSLHQEFTCMNKYASRGDFLRTIADLRQKPAGSLQIFFIPADCLWDEEWMAEALRALDRFNGFDKHIRIVFAADPVKTWRWLALSAERRAELQLDRIQSLFSLTPWHDSLLRTWLDDLGIRADEHERAEITDLTGNYPILLDRFYRAVSADLRDWQPHMHAMRNLFDDYREELGLAFGLHLSEPATVLRELARRGRAAAGPLAEATGLAPDLVAASLEWADLLGYLQPIASKERNQMEWQLTPLLHRLLAS
jgi:hypothetical protein